MNKSLYISMTSIEKKLFFPGFKTIIDFKVLIAISDYKTVLSKSWQDFIISIFDTFIEKYGLTFSYSVSMFKQFMSFQI